MSRLHALVEGHTEQTFFNTVLREHLAARGVFADCTMICTARQGGTRKFRGGHGHRWVFIIKRARREPRPRGHAAPE